MKGRMIWAFGLNDIIWLLFADTQASIYISFHLFVTQTTCLVPFWVRDVDDTMPFGEQTLQ
jgi:hypothetical protein